MKKASYELVIAGLQLNLRLDSTVREITVNSEIYLLTKALNFHGLWRGHGGTVSVLVICTVTQFHLGTRFHFIFD